jgi:hypothetical protein
MMNHLNKNNNGLIAAAATILTVAAIIMATSSMMTAPAAASTNTTAETATTPAFSSGIELSPQPIYQEHSSDANITPINQTHATLTFTGNGMLTS